MATSIYKGEFLVTVSPTPSISKQLLEDSSKQISDFALRYIHLTSNKFVATFESNFANTNDNWIKLFTVVKENQLASDHLKQELLKKLREIKNTHENDKSLVERIQVVTRKYITDQVNAVKKCSQFF